MTFTRTDPSTLTPTILVYPDRVQLPNGTVKQIASGNNAVKYAADQAKPGDVLGIFGRHRALSIGDGNTSYADSVNKPGGLHHVHFLAMSGDAEFVGTTIVYQRKGNFGGSGFCGFFGFLLTGTTGYGLFQTCMGDPPSYGWEFEGNVFAPTFNQYSCIRTQGPAQLSVRKNRFLRGQKEHCVYAENPPDDTKVDDNSMESPGRCGVQIVDRIESGPPQKGKLKITHNRIDHPRDAFAITVAGQADAEGQVLIANNEIEVDGNVEGSTAGGIIVYAERPDVTLPTPKLGAWPVGSTGQEGYGVGHLPPASLPCVNRVILKNNHLVGNNLKKQLIAVGSAKLLHVENGYFESNNKNALDINHNSMIERVELTFDHTYRGWKDCAGLIYDVKTGKPVKLSNSQIDALQVIEGTQVT